jgi:hypothetical protein
VNRIAHDGTLLADAPAASPDGSLYARWRTGPTYRLVNLAGDPPAWQSVDLDLLELLVFDQCLVFGAAYPGTGLTLDAIARRDAVVRQARDTISALYRAFAGRVSVDRRLQLLRDVAHAVAGGAGSAGSLLPFRAYDPEPAVVAAALTAGARLAATADG